jgi:hypothetical protein
MTTSKLPARDDCLPEYENRVKEQGQKVRPPLQAAWLSDSEDIPHEQAQIQAGDVDEHSLEDVAVAAKMSASHSAGFERLGEGTFEQFAALAQQCFPALATNASPIAMHRVAFVVLALPVPATSVRLGDVAADRDGLEPVSTALL